MSLDFMECRACALSAFLISQTIHFIRRNSGAILSFLHAVFLVELFPIYEYSSYHRHTRNKVSSTLPIHMNETKVNNWDQFIGSYTEVGLVRAENQQTISTLLYIF